MKHHLVFPSASVLTAALALPFAANAGELLRHGAAKQKALFLRSETVGAPIQLSAELDKLFRAPICPLPQRIKKAIDDDGQDAVPRDLESVLKNDYRADAQQVQQSSVNAVLLTIEVRLSPNGDYSEPLRLLDSDTYKTLQPLAYVDTNATNVAYTMDCSGYLNAAVAAYSGFFSVDTKASAEAALQTHAAFAVVDATVFSPVAIAMESGLGLSSNMPLYTRLDLLYQIEKEAKIRVPSIAPSIAIKTGREIKLLWTSNNGESSFQGEADIGAEASVGVAVANMQGNVQGGGNLSRTINYHDFDTYSMPSDLPTDAYQSTYGELHDELVSLVRGAGASNIGLQSSGGMTSLNATFVDIPQAICERRWNVATTTSASAGAVQGKFEKGCQIVLNSGMAQPGQTVTLTASSPFINNANFQLTFAVPK